MLRIVKRVALVMSALALFAAPVFGTAGAKTGPVLSSYACGSCGAYYYPSAGQAHCAPSSRTGTNGTPTVPGGAYDKDPEKLYGPGILDPNWVAWKPAETVRKNMGHTIVKVQKTNLVDVFSGPSYTTAKIASLKTGDSLIVYDTTITTEGWVRIYWAGQTAWAHLVDFVVDYTTADRDVPFLIDIPTNAQAGWVTSDHAILSESGARLGTVRAGTYAVVTGTSGDRYTVLYDSVVGTIDPAGVSLSDIPGVD